MISCVVIDDEPLGLKVINAFIDRTPLLELKKAFTDPFLAIEYLKDDKVDLLFLDIQMPELNGIELFKSLRQPPATIFTTAFSEYAIEGFNLDALDYLLKPFTYERFLKAINKASDFIQYSKIETIEPQNEDFIFLKSEYQLVKIDLNEVLYFEALDDYVKVFTTESVHPILSLISMKALMAKLPLSKFMRVHRSFIVSLRRIENVRNKRIKIRGKYILIGDSYSERFFKVIGS